MNGALNPYPEYKDAGVPWLEKIPAHWEILHGKTLFRRVDVRSETGEEELLSVSENYGVVPRRHTTVTMFKAESYVGHKLCWPGDLVINTLWAWKGGLGFSRYHGIVSSVYGVYRLIPNYSRYWRFLDHLLRSKAYDWEFHVRSKGVWISRLKITDDDFLTMPIIVPPPDEVDQIARFLAYHDRLTRRYVRAQRHLIELLIEQKQTLIQQAVTRGLDIDVPLKDSGIEWLGEIPAHWEVNRLKFLASHIVDCLHATPEYVSDGKYPAIRTADVNVGQVNVDAAKRVARDQYLLWTSRLTPRVGDILYTREGERYGLAALVPQNVELCISQRMMLFRIREPCRSDYLMWQLNCPHVYSQAAADVIGATSPHVNIERIRNYVLVVPPPKEQQEIAVWIETLCRDIEVICARAKKEIALIREYRTRLIADVVTGKLDVRGVSLPDMAEAGDLGALDDLEEDAGLDDLDTEELNDADD